MFQLSFYLKGNVSLHEVRVVQHLQRVFLDGLVQVEVSVEEHEGHVVPPHVPRGHARLVEGLVGGQHVAVSQQRHRNLGARLLE